MKVDEPNRLRGLALQSEGMAERALPYLMRALSVQPDDPEVLRAVAAAQYTLGRYEVALEWSARAIATEPDRAYGHRLRSLTLSLLERDDEALASASEAVRLAPHSAESHLRLSNVLQNLKRLEEALHHAERAVELDAGNASAWTRLGWVAEALKNRVVAERAFRKALALDPKAGLSGLGSLSPTDDAVDLYRRALELDPTNTSTQKNLALKLCRLGRWEEAYSLTRLLRRMYPTDPMALEMFARSTLNSGRAEETVSLEAPLLECAERVRGKKDEYRTYEGLGHVYLAKQAWPEAQAAYARALELKAWCCLAVGVGRAAIRQSDPVTAAAMYERACADNPCEARCALISDLAAALQR